MYKKVTFLLFTIFLTLNLNASDKKVGDFANQCSALFLIMTMLPDDEQWKPFVDNMSNLSETMGMLSGTIYEANNISLTQGKLIDLRNLEADKFINMYKANTNNVTKFYARCDKFREDFAYQAMLNSDDDMKLINALSIPGSVDMSQQKTALIEMILEMSFNQLSAAGIESIVEFYKELKKDLRNP